MADQRRPRSREKHVTGSSAGVHRRGEGLGTGPVGSGSGRAGGSGTGQRNSGGAGGPKRSGSGRSPIAIIIGLLVVLLGGGGGAVSMLEGSSGNSDTGSAVQQAQSSYTGANTSAYMPQTAMSSISSGNHIQSAAEAADLTVSSDARDKYTVINGNNQDQVTVMIYMCGTDLESRSSMASSDIQEMAAADFGDFVNLILYTGGCKSWKIQGISSDVNQIYRVRNGNLERLESNMGDKAMTDPATLTEFIRYCRSNFPANRNELILWDHGGGSLSGYGYDEKRPSSGSMSLTGISEALKNADMKFDFIGFDACLMATAENALMLDSYADYMIASEETEPGIGWYYTTWLNTLGKDPSIHTVTLGKSIVDSFVEECNTKCRGQLTTLSVVDLAEFSAVVPEKLNAFSNDTIEMIQAKEYKTVAAARQGAREFAVSSKIDQVDLVDLAQRIDADSSKELSEAIQGAVKYNRTSTNISNAYGISIYFPNRKPGTVNNAVQINNALGVDEEYSSCIKAYAALQIPAQSVSQNNGNNGSAFDLLLGGLGGGGTSNSDTVLQILQQMMVSSAYDLSGGRSLSIDDAADYLAENQFDASRLSWNEDGTLSLSEKQWSLVTDLALNMFYDDGEGYVDLGLDNVYSFDENGSLIPETDHTWLAINGQPVAYYYTGTVENGDGYSIQGTVPAMLNGSRVNLLLEFTSENPYGTITGTVTDYRDGETETIAKSDLALEEGDELDFLCDFYSYEGEYLDSYYLGEEMTVTEDLEISNVPVGDGDVLITYRFTDIYDNHYWTPVLEH
ncbi:MAG: clostripain-related cysteine peptidase [Lachnospiraceae bacterium]|nr:clostripain-related cysteine peptidase [Lachnospiraceae bacterium]